MIVIIFHTYNIHMPSHTAPHQQPPNGCGIIIARARRIEEPTRIHQPPPARSSVGDGWMDGLDGLDGLDWIGWGKAPHMCVCIMGSALRSPLTRYMIIRPTRRDGFSLCPGFDFSHSERESVPVTVYCCAVCPTNKGIVNLGLGHTQ
jgi:hypothetical protein